MSFFVVGYGTEYRRYFSQPEKKIMSLHYKYPKET